MKTAVFVKRHDGAGEGRIYRVDPPILLPQGQATSYVWVSAVNAWFTGPETYIFASTAEGEVLDWDELDGSFRGDKDHVQALLNAGYQVLEVQEEEQL